MPAPVNQPAQNPILRRDILPEAELPDATATLEAGRALARDWQVGRCPFLVANDCDSEATYKRRCMTSGRIMQHAHMGFRDAAKSRRAYAEIHDLALARGVTIDRYGICLDWSMGLPRAQRSADFRGTGLLLDDTDDFVALTASAPVAPHFGDFVLGFPAAVENTCAALAAGSTVIGNLGQYFTFDLPHWKDDIATTTATLQAIALMAAQPVDVLVHSNLDDGFAAVFTDLSCALGATLLEKYLVEELVGGQVCHCFGHHYATPLLRFSFQQALARTSPHPGSMIYGNTTSYRGTPAENYASLSGYLSIDIAGQRAIPSGHAVNPVPVTENQRIPDIDEILDAQLFAHRLAEVTTPLSTPLDPGQVADTVDTLERGAHLFRDNVLRGLEAGGFDIRNPVEMFLAIRRIGGKRLEQAFAPWVMPGQQDQAPRIRSDTLNDIDARVQGALAAMPDHIGEKALDGIRGGDLRIVTATTDVHEHSKLMLEGILDGLQVAWIDGGISVDPDDLAQIAEGQGADAIALSTYCGVALNYFGRLKDELTERGLDIPVMIGGQLNQIPEDDPDSLPVDVGSELEARGAVVCRTVFDMLPCLSQLSGRPSS